MADFCTKCHIEHGFPGKPDIDVEAIFESLEEGYMINVGSICEGCGIISVAKKNKDTCLVGREINPESFVWDPYDL